MSRRTNRFVCHSCHVYCVSFNIECSQERMKDKVDFYSVSHCSRGNACQGILDHSWLRKFQEGVDSANVDSSS